MDKINNLNEREKLPSIYSSNSMHLRALSSDNKNNVLKSFDYSIYNKKSNFNIRNYYDEINYINNRYEKNRNVNNCLKISINNRDEKNSDKNEVLTYYNNNELNFKNSYRGGVLEKLKQKNKSINNSILSNRILNKKNYKENLFNDSYYNYLLNLKKKKEILNISRENDKKEISKENSKVDSIHSINNENFKLKNNIIDNNNKINERNLHETKTIENDKNFNPKITNKFRIVNNTNNKNNEYQKFYSSNRSNTFGMLNYNFNTSKFNNSRNNSLSNKKVCPLCNQDIDYYRFRAHLNLHPSKIFDWLYLGSYRNACNIKDLKDLKINYILNCAVECENKKLPAEINYFHAKINDSPLFEISSFFDKTNSFINTAKISGGKILIHCQLGISRSTTCLIAYMIKYLGYTTLSALQYIKNKRPHAMPNLGFIQQLKEYENKVKFGEKNYDKNALKKEEKFDLFIKQNL